MFGVSGLIVLCFRIWWLLGVDLGLLVFCLRFICISLVGVWLFNALGLIAFEVVWTCCWVCG